MQIRFVVSTVEAWFRKQFREGRGYNEIIRELLTTPVTQNGNPINPYDRRATRRWPSSRRRGEAREPGRRGPRGRSWACG